jgi:hypothetical protein
VLHILIGNILNQHLRDGCGLVFPYMILSISYLIFGNDSHRLVGNGRWSGGKGSNWKGKGKGWQQNNYNDQPAVELRANSDIPSKYENTSLATVVQGIPSSPRGRGGHWTCCWLCALT